MSTTAITPGSQLNFSSVNSLPPFVSPESQTSPTLDPLHSLSSRNISIMELPSINDPTSNQCLPSPRPESSPSIARSEPAPQPPRLHEERVGCCAVISSCCQLLNCVAQAEITAQAVQNLQGNPSAADAYIDIAAIQGNSTAGTAVSLRGNQPILLNPHRCDCCVSCVRECASSVRDCSTGIFNCFKAIICCIPRCLHSCQNQIPPDCCRTVGEVACQCIGFVGECFHFVGSLCPN